MKREIFSLIRGVTMARAEYSLNPEEKGSCGVTLSLQVKTFPTLQSVTCCSQTSLWVSERGVNTREWGNELSDWDWWDSCHDFIYTDCCSSLQPGWHLQQKWNGNLGQQQVSYLAWSDLKLLMQIYSGVFISIIHYVQNTIASVVSDI